MNPRLSRRSALVGGGAALAAGLAACAPPNPGEVNAELAVSTADEVQAAVRRAASVASEVAAVTALAWICGPVMVVAKTVAAA